MYLIIKGCTLFFYLTLLIVSEADLTDDYLRYDSSTSSQFFEIESRSEDLQVLTRNSVIDIAILMASSRDKYERIVFSIFDLFGIVGGLYGLLSSLWGLIIGFIATQIMLSSVFRRLYFTNIFSVDEFEQEKYCRKNINANKLEEENKIDNMK